jgi:hypothetical protein
LSEYARLEGATHLAFSLTMFLQSNDGVRRFLTTTAVVVGVWSPTKKKKKRDTVNGRGTRNSSQ